MGKELTNILSYCQGYTYRCGQNIEEVETAVTKATALLKKGEKSLDAFAKLSYEGSADAAEKERKQFVASVKKALALINAAEKAKKQLQNDYTKLDKYQINLHKHIQHREKNSFWRSKSHTKEAKELYQKYTQFAGRTNFALQRINRIYDDAQGLSARSIFK